MSSSTSSITSDQKTDSYFLCRCCSFDNTTLIKVALFVGASLCLGGAIGCIGWGQTLFPSFFIVAKGQIITGCILGAGGLIFSAQLIYLQCRYRPQLSHTSDFAEATSALSPDSDSDFIPVYPIPIPVVSNSPDPETPDTTSPPAPEMLAQGERKVTIAAVQSSYKEEECFLLETSQALFVAIGEGVSAPMKKRFLTRFRDASRLTSQNRFFAACTHVQTFSLNDRSKFKGIIYLDKKCNVLHYTANFLKIEEGDKRGIKLKKLSVERAIQFAEVVVPQRTEICIYESLDKYVKITTP